MGKREIGVFTEDKKKNRSLHVLIMRVYHKLSSWVKKENKGNKEKTHDMYCINKMNYFYILLYWDITDIPVGK